MTELAAVLDHVRATWRHVVVQQYTTALPGRVALDDATREAVEQDLLATAAGQSGGQRRMVCAYNGPQWVLVKRGSRPGGRAAGTWFQPWQPGQEIPEELMVTACLTVVTLPALLDTRLEYGLEDPSADPFTDESASETSVQ